MNQLMGFASDSVSNPSKAIEPLRTGGYARINKIFDMAPKNMLEASAARGNAGMGGNVDRAMKDLDIARYGALSSLENDLAPLGLQQQNTGASLIQSILGQFAEQQTNANSTGTNKISGGWNLGFGGGGNRSFRGF